MYIHHKFKNDINNTSNFLSSDYKNQNLVCVLFK